MENADSLDLEKTLAGSQRRFDLRMRTQTAHKRLDAAVDGFDSLEQYRGYVARLRAFRTAMETALQRVAWPDDWSWRPTTVAKSLREDAVDLGLPVTEPIGINMNLVDRSDLLGALYVLEGSKLGARVLRQRAAELGLDEVFGARHLAVMSKDIAQWQTFLIILDETPQFDIERSAASANAVFAFALQCFEREFLVVH